MVAQIATALLYQCFRNFFDFHLFINTGDTFVAFFYSIFEIGFLLLFKEIKRNFAHIVAFRVFCSVVMRTKFLGFSEAVDAGKEMCVDDEFLPALLGETISDTDRELTATNSRWWIGHTYIDPKSGN